MPMSKRKTNKSRTTGNTLTTVKTAYARAVVLLLALNFCLTGYAVHSLVQIQSEVLSMESTSQAVAQSASTE